jgi:branched-chain amino acid transport system permease protein
MMEWLETIWSTYNTLIMSIGINSLLALSIALTLSCGLLSLANAAFMGIGAYTAATLTMQFNMPFELALLMGIITPILVAHDYWHSYFAPFW